MARKKSNVAAFSLISMMDMLTGALGAVILLFAIVPKQRLAIDASVNTRTVALWQDATSGDLWGTLPDSIKNTYAIKKGDTLLVVIADYKNMPGDDVAYVPSDNTGSSSRPPRWATGDPDGKDLQKPEVAITPGDTKCVVSANIGRIQCDPNGTPENPDDDVFSFEILVSGANVGKNGWSAAIGGRVIMGQYDQMQRVTGVKIVPAPYKLTLRDRDKPAEGVFETEVASPPVCSEKPKPPGVPAKTVISGRLVVDLKWDDRTKDLDIILEKGGSRCYAANPKTSFAEWPKLQAKMRDKTQEYIKWEKDPVPGQYNVYVWHHNRKDGPMKGKVVMEIRNKEKVTIFSEPDERNFQYSSFPGTKIGILTINPDGTASYVKQ
jgi:hypothetical protein